MRTYELVVLLHPDLEIDLEKPLKKIENLIAEHKGVILKRDNWGKRKLAYTIKKQDFAIYVYYELELPPESILKFDSTLNITDEVLRHLLTKPIAPPKGMNNQEENAAAEETTETAETKEGK